MITSINVVENFLKENKISVTLDIRYSNGQKRKQIRLKGVYYANAPRNAIEREHKKEMKDYIKRYQAQLIAAELNGDTGFGEKYDLGKDFYEYAQEFIQRKAPKSETRTYSAVVNKLKNWHKKPILPCSDITESLMFDFKDFLDASLNGISSHNYFKKLKRIFKEATIAKHFKKNPTEAIVNIKQKSAIKDTLTMDEISILASTSCSNVEVKNAFLFCCLVGLRFCDVKTLKWENIVGKSIDIIQSKTKDRLTFPLSKDALNLIGDRDKNNVLLFRLPSHTACLKILKKWMGDANIGKHITWHCARHSLGTNLAEYEVDPFVLSKILGHRNINQSLVYTRISELRKLNAIEKLPTIF